MENYSQLYTYYSNWQPILTKTVIVFFYLLFVIMKASQYYKKKSCSIRQILNQLRRNDRQKMEIGEVQRLIKQKIFFNSNCIIFDIKRMRINLKEKSKDQETIRLVSSISQIPILKKKFQKKRQALTHGSCTTCIVYI